MTFRTALHLLFIAGHEFGTVEIKGDQMSLVPIDASGSTVDPDDHVITFERLRPTQINCDKSELKSLMERSVWKTQVGDTELTWEIGKTPNDDPVEKGSHQSIEAIGEYYFLNWRPKSGGMVKFILDEINARRIKARGIAEEAAGIWLERVE